MIDVDDLERVRLFEEGRLEPFGHPEHVRVMFGLLSIEPLDEATRRMSAGIRRIAEAHDNPRAFHVTRTVAWTRLIAAAAEATPAVDSDALLAAHPELLRRDLLNDYYSADLLTSDAARDGFVEPDLRDFGA
jgi:hypothetical protein